jgi:hypothetical protein
VLRIGNRNAWSPHGNECGLDLDGLLVELVKEALASFRNVLDKDLSLLVDSQQYLVELLSHHADKDKEFGQNVGKHRNNAFNTLQTETVLVL